MRVDNAHRRARVWVRRPRTGQRRCRQHVTQPGSLTDRKRYLRRVRLAINSRHALEGTTCRFCADIVAKVFLGCRTKILRATDAFYARRREGPHRFTRNRSRTSVVALKSDAAAEKSNDQLSRHFPGRSIFDFCNNIGTKRTWRDVRLESVMGSSKADVC